MCPCPPGWVLPELTCLRGHRVLPVTLHRAGGVAVSTVTVCFVCFFSFTFIVTLYFETFLDLQAHKSISEHSCVPFALRPYSGFPTARTQGSSLLWQRDPIRVHGMTCCLPGSVLSVSLAFMTWTCLNSPVFSQMPLDLGLSDVSSQ